VRLRQFSDSWLPELMSWFPDRESCQVWGGPEFRFPFTETSFREDAKLGSLPSWALLRDDGTLAGFGQCYLRADRCHLGRLAIAPAFRGQGFGSTLVRELCRWGRAEFGVESCSLFVMPSNVQAMRLYERLGFAQVPYPEPVAELQEFIYMVAAQP
jgi:ribosomal protein S18 acetylase RimI-like enzyme